MLEPVAERGRISRRAWVGEHVIMPCVASGFPVPETTWFRVDGVGLRQVLPTPRIRYHLEVLIIHDLLVDDSGIYVCIVNNTLGSERVEVNLTVQSPLGVRVDPPNQTVDLNKEAVFRCSAVGAPRQRLTWFKNGNPLPQRGRRCQTFPNGTLRISSVQEGDEGSYQCVVRNEADFAQATGSLRLGESLPTLLFKFTGQTIQPGPPVSLKCITKGNPLPSIHWLLDGFPIPHNERFVVGQHVTARDDVVGHLNITQVEAVDGGAYSCQAENSVGVEVHSARLNVYGPPFVRSAPTAVAIEGHFFLVSCPASGFPIERILWQKDGRELRTDSRRKVFPNGSLAIDSATKLHDEGYYSCTAFSPEARSSSGTVKVEVKTPPNIMPFLFPNKVLTEGMRSAVSCQILEGNLPVNFAWSKDGKSISGVAVVVDGATIRSNDEYSSTFIIDRLQFFHRGNYTCTATNAAGASSHTAELIVNVPPKWIQEPHDLQAVEGQDLILPCLVEGYPQPTTVWTMTNDFGALNYQVLPLGLSYHQLPNGSLSIASASKESEGTYTCTAQNGVRTGISKTINVSVNAPPRFEEKAVRLSVRKGEKTSLICEASGDPPMDMFWTRNGMTIAEDDDARFTILHHKTENEAISRFIVSPVLEQDGGQITCEAANRYGRDQKAFLLSVEDIPSPPTRIRLSSIKSRSLEISWMSSHNGNSPILNYVVEYSNLPDRREQGERQRRKMTAPGNAVSLIVQNLRPGMRYKFSASAQNKHGISQESPTVTTRMMEEAPTAKPGNLEATAKSSTKLDIRWHAPPKDHWNSEKLGYKIGFREVDESDDAEFVEVRPSNQPSQRFELSRGLKKFTSYRIMIQPYNDEGLGPASDSIIVTTMEDVPSGSPENVHCQSRSSNSILLEWSKPKREERNGIIRGYWIEYYPRTLWYGGTNGRLQTKETEGEMLELDGLDVYTNYSISVSAFTRAGRGNSSRRIYCRTAEDVPSAPADIKAVAANGHGSAIVSWRAPAFPNGIVQRYNVHRRVVVDGREVDANEISVLSGPNHLELTELRPGRRYDFWVEAETSAGRGASSDVASIIPVDAGSGGVRARIVSFGEILAVPWKSNLVLDCLHVGQPVPLVEWSRGHGPIRDDLRHRMLPNGSLNVERLAESDQGDYTCRVNNERGNDRISYKVIVQIPPVPPELTIANVTHTAIKLSWRGARSRKQPVLGYTVNYRRDRGGQWMKIDAHPLADRMWLESYDMCGNNYTIYMTAYNHVGHGHPSTVARAKTLGRVPDVPNASRLLSINKTLVAIHLDSFGDGGCDIRHFSIQYRRRAQPEYTTLANNVTPREGSYTIRGLDPASRYFVKITAHNSAGSSVAEYPFATLTAQGLEIAPASAGGKTSLGSSSRSFGVAVKLISTVFLSTCLLVALFYSVLLLRSKWRSKRRLNSFHHDLGSSGSGRRPTFHCGSTYSEQNGSFGPTSLKPNRNRDESPTLPPFKSSDRLFAAAAGVSYEPHDGWNRDVDHYATIQRTGDDQRQVIMKLRSQQEFASSSTSSTLPRIGGGCVASASNASLADPLFCNPYFAASVVPPPPSDASVLMSSQTLRPKSRFQPLYAKLKLRSRGFPSFGSRSRNVRPSVSTASTSNPTTDSSAEASSNATAAAGTDHYLFAAPCSGIPLAALSSAANVEAEDVVRLHHHQRQLFHVRDVLLPPPVATYDSDSDFDYRLRPPRPNYRAKRLKERRKPSPSSSSSSDDSDSISPLPRVRSVEALEFLCKAKQQRSASLRFSENGHQRHYGRRHLPGRQRTLPAGDFRFPPGEESANYTFGSGSIQPPMGFLDVVATNQPLQLPTADRFSHHKPEVRTLGRPHKRPNFRI